MNAKDRAIRSIFDDDDDDTREDVSIFGVKKRESTKSSSSRSRFDEDDDEADKAEIQTGADEDRGKVLARNALLESIVQELRQEIFTLKSEIASLKASLPLHSESSHDHNSLDKDTTDDLSSNDADFALKLPKQSKTSRGVLNTNSSEWERLAQLEKERRQTKRSSAHRRVKRPAGTASQIVNQKEEEASNAGNPQTQSSIQGSSKEHVKRRDSFFDASSGSSDEEQTDVREQPKDFLSHGSDDFAWDDDYDEVPAIVNEEIAFRTEALPNLNEERVQLESQVLKWARGKDIISMIASLSYVFKGALDYRLPPAWTWTGSDVADRSSISDVDIRKAYLRVVRIVHPDKLTNAEKTLQIQAQAVFTALSDAYAAHNK